MADMLIITVEDSTSDEEIKAFMVRYGFPPFDRIRRVPGTGSRPAVLLSFDGVDHATLRALEPKIQNLFWKDHTLHVQVMTERSD
jgi:hypothetical protein